MSVRKMSEIELKPYPFCGGEADLKQHRTIDGQLCPEIAYVECNNCGCSTRKYWLNNYYGSTDTIADSIEAWNRRADNA